MSDPWWLERIGLVALLLLLSGLFSGSETALFSLSRVKREAMATRADARDHAVLRLLRHPRRLIVTIILCNELVNIGISTVMAGVGERWIERLGIVHDAWTTAITAAVTIPLIVLVGDMTPKTLAIKISDRWARAVARPLAAAAWVLTPVREIVRLVAEGILRLVGSRMPTQEQGIREEEFRALVDVGEKEGEVEGAERRLIHNVFEFGDRTVSEVMTPAARVFALPWEMPLGRMVEAIAASRYSRVPIIRRAKRSREVEVVGILHAKDLVGYSYGHLEGHTIQELLKPPFFVPRSTKCDRLFREFQRRKTHLALVVDEYGRLAGLVTMEDLLEELFGEIVDEKEVARREGTPVREAPTSPAGGSEITGPTGRVTRAEAADPDPGHDVAPGGLAPAALPLDAMAAGPLPAAESGNSGLSSLSDSSQSSAFAEVALLEAATGMSPFPSAASLPSMVDLPGSPHAASDGEPAPDDVADPDPRPGPGPGSDPEEGA